MWMPCMYAFEVHEAGSAGQSYPLQVIQHCFWMDLREHRPSSFSLSQNRDDMLFFLHSRPVLVLHSCKLHVLIVSGLFLWSQRLFSTELESSTTHGTTRCCIPPPQLTEHFSQSCGSQ